MSKNIYSIRQVVDLTGASEYLLRVWENRYDAFEPSRTGTLRRLYSIEDIKRAKTLLDLTKRGHRIGKIAGLSLRALEELLAEMGESTPSDSVASEECRVVVGLGIRFDWDGVRDIFKEQIRNLEPKDFLVHFILPLLELIGHKVAAGELSIAQEHIFSAMVREAVSAVAIRRKKRPHARMVFATVEGEQHDLGILIASRLAALAGVDTLMIGANVPREDLAESCLRYHATHLLLSSTFGRKPGENEVLLSAINFLNKNLGSQIAFWIAGPGVKSLPIALKRNHKILGTFEDYLSALALLSK